jgi:hypothetical protein
VQSDKDCAGALGWLAYQPENVGIVTRLFIILELDKKESLPYYVALLQFPFPNLSHLHLCIDGNPGSTVPPSIISSLSRASKLTSISLTGVYSNLPNNCFRLAQNCPSLRMAKVEIPGLVHLEHGSLDALTHLELSARGEDQGNVGAAMRVLFQTLKVPRSSRQAPKKVLTPTMYRALE